MGCCKCEGRGYGWDDPQPVVYADPADGQEYCVFHAPKDEKRKELGRDERYSVDEFNALVFARIDEAKAQLRAGEKDAECNLSRTVFPGDISFTYKNFANPLPPLTLFGAVFTAKVLFDYAEVVGEACFQEAIFYMEAGFYETIFRGQANFIEATFKSTTYFYETQFKGDAYFHKSTFSAEAGFIGSVFRSEVDFAETTITGKAKFNYASFRGNADFSNAVFDGGAIFYGACFSAQINFNMVMLNGITTFKSTYIKGQADFNNVSGNNDGNIQMLDMDSHSLGNISFTRAELPLFSFRNSRWPSRLGIEQYGIKNISEPGTPDNLLECEELYRAMKERAAKESDQPMVSVWHFREKLMQLKGLLPDEARMLVDRFEDHSLDTRTRLQAWRELFRALPWRLWRSLLFLYWTCSGFGERHRRAWWCLAGLAVLPLAPLIILKLLETGLSWRVDWLRVCQVIAEWVRCMPLVKLDAAIVEDAPLVSSFRAGLSWLFQVAIGLQAALFALAVRNRYRR